MSYIHDAKRPVTLRSHPIDPNSTDWVVFSYGTDLLSTESITAHSALIDGGTIVTDSVYLGDMTDEEGNEHTECYGVQFSVTEGSSSVSVTHRTSRSIAGAPVLSRLAIDRTAVIPVKSL